MVCAAAATGRPGPLLGSAPYGAGLNMRHAACAVAGVAISTDVSAQVIFCINATPHADKGGIVARKTIRVSDRSGQEIPEGKGATVRITFADARKGVRELDLTDAEAESLGGRAVARRGRRPKGMS